MLVLPAVGTTFTVDEVLADPIAANTALGHYTHFGNLLDLCAAVVPAGLTVRRPAGRADGARAGAGRRPGAGHGRRAGRRGERRCRADPLAGRRDPTAAPRLWWSATTSSGPAAQRRPRRPRRRTCSPAPRPPPSYRLLRVRRRHPVPALVRVAVRRRRDRGGDLVGALRSRARDPRRLVAVGLPRPGHPGRRQHPRSASSRTPRSSPTRTPPTSPSSAAGAATSPPSGRRPLTDGQPPRIPARPTRERMTDVPDTRSPAPTRSSSTPNPARSRCTLAHRAGGDRHAARLPAARRIRRDPRQRRRSLLQKVVAAAGRRARRGPGGRHARHPHQRGAPARPVGLPAGEAAARASRRSGSATRARTAAS